MLDKLFFYLKGYIILRIQEYEKERFLNLCKAKEIEIIDIVAINNAIYGKISIQDYRKIRPVVKKTGCIPKIEKKCGLPFGINALKVRKGIIIGIILGIILLTQLSRRIWYIDVSGGFIHTREQIIRILKEELSVYGGVGRESVNPAEIERKLRLIYNEIGWVSVEKKGCNLYIRLNESTMPEIPDSLQEPQHIIAERDGVVKELEVISGIAQVAVGDEVKKGEVLITGIVPVVGDYDELIRKNPVGAQGKVWIETDFSYEAVYPMKKEEKIETGHKTGIGIFLFQKKLFSYIPRYSTGKYDIIVFDMVPFVFRDYAAPVLIRIYEVRAYETMQKQLSDTVVEEQAKENFFKFLSDWEKQNVQILDWKFRTEYKSQSCKATGSGIVRGNFVSYQEILEEEWKAEYEYSGNNP